ncbi:MFS transporter permease [Microbacterium sp. EYE_5]|nr:MFS transporter permease [Microbacterium sp. EYE_382]MCK6086134.1 MFS transporter permease [Microbacterium sp. EYE_384]MCK6124368.1 MFS transporter permease [Microbacterium sp. EYE_80]MCK6127277.1 MFS transporter permease [Microbacterium sp. EYE_79]MCK6141818.1 MFS transporter permease [Microbacterium sp. EYE_39]MCK6218923.1 MFS transporter permease [Microbacterium sp. EYE_5]MCK6228319.1 MFS transporter permease [Microbacterium sp. EYE_77]MCK6247783.1 MFS transporter permease [Microbacter
MLVRRGFFHWLLPSAAVLPAWLIAGWIIADAGGWALAWILIIAIPSVLVGQLAVTLLVRSRGTVRHSRTVSWWDVAGIGLWHVLTIGVGFFSEVWFWPLLVAAVVVYLAVFWSSVRQLLQEARPSAVLRRYTAPADQATSGVVVVEERREP